MLKLDLLAHVDVEVACPVCAEPYEIPASTVLEMMTNNPEKMDALRELGVEVRERVSAVVDANPLSRAYLATKRTRMGHLR